MERECREKQMTPSSRPLRTVAAGGGHQNDALRWSQCWCSQVQQWCSSPPCHFLDSCHGLTSTMEFPMRRWRMRLRLPGERLGCSQEAGAARGGARTGAVSVGLKSGRACVVGSVSHEEDVAFITWLGESQALSRHLTNLCAAELDHESKDTHRSLEPSKLSTQFSTPWHAQAHGPTRRASGRRMTDSSTVRN